MFLWTLRGNMLFVYQNLKFLWQVVTAESFSFMQSHFFNTGNKEQSFAQ